MKQGRWAIAIICTIIGMMLVFQFRVTKDISKDNISMQRVGDLTSKLKDTEAQRDALKEKLDQIMKKGTYETLTKENKILKYNAGLTPVSGEGIIITIADSINPVKSGENPNLYIIHDEDILKIINELKAAGAEAISINGQRIVSMTEIRCVGPTITINRKSFAPPFIIKAIGNAKSLQGALTLRGGIGETLKYWGIDMKIEERKDIHIPAYKGPFPKEYSTISQEGES